MRTIKFRQWRDGKMLQVKTIWLGYCGHPVYLPGAGDTLAPIMQFTGLLDKNGKEIYEGDIIEYRNVSGVGSGIGNIIFDQYKFKVDFYDDEDDLYNFDGYLIKVIGNIYENPELLTN